MTAQTTTKAKPGPKPSTTDTAKAATTATAATQQESAAASSGEPAPSGTYRGWVIERPGAKGELPSYFRVGEGWTWDKGRATNFGEREDAKPLIARKRPALDNEPARPAGPASGEGAKIVKFDEGADD